MASALIDTLSVNLHAHGKALPGAVEKCWIRFGVWLPPSGGTPRE
ncbi:MAG: hypothetical protein P4L90_13230 [Rhodopila sp.]|nr:hypothetical protein [Rhodopila sp.]